jgi:hypothetical protein
MPDVGATSKSSAVTASKLAHKYVSVFGASAHFPFRLAPTPTYRLAAIDSAAAFRKLGQRDGADPARVVSVLATIALASTLLLPKMLMSVPYAYAAAG